MTKAVQIAISALLDRIENIARARSGVISLAAYSFGALGLLYLASKVFFDSSFSLDFKYFWLAGKAWADGVNPYSEQFNELGRAYFPNENALNLWYYPPNWWVITRFLVSFDYGTALIIWRAASGLMLIGGAFLLRQGLKARGLPVNGTWFAFFLGFVASSQPTALSINYGQTGTLIFFGACVSAYGLLARRNAATVAGLAVLALKPHIVVLFSLFLLAYPRYRWTVIQAAIISAVLTLPVFVTIGFGETIAGFLDTISQHKEFGPNSPGHVIGFQSLIYWTTGLKTGGVSYLVVMMLAVAGAAAWRRSVYGQEGPQDGEGLLLLLSFALSLVAFILPFHNYDLLILTPILLFAFHFRRVDALVLVLAFMAIYRYITSVNLAARFLGVDCAQTDICAMASTAFATGAELVILLVVVVSTLALKAGGDAPASASTRAVKGDPAS